MNRLFKLVAIIISAAVAAGADEAGNNGGRTVGPGVTWNHEFLTEGPLNYNVLTVEIDNPLVTVEAESGKDRLNAGERVLDSARREAEPGSTQIIGGVNADFWSNNPRMFSPVGLLVADGMIYNMPSRRRSAFVLTDNERPFIGQVSLQVSLSGIGDSFQIDRINSGTDSDNEIVLFTPPYGNVRPAKGRRFKLTLESPDTPFIPNQPVQVSLLELDTDSTTSLSAGNLILHIPPGKARSFPFQSGQRIRLSAVMPQVKEPVVSVVGGGPSIVNDGKVHVPLEKENIPKSFSETRHPRTALGYSKDRKTLYFVTVDGRQPGLSIGASLEELGAYMVKLGCWAAINLDGGGSTTMVVNDKVVNRPSDFKGPRTVANSLLVVAENGGGPPAKLTFELPEGRLLVPVGATVNVAVSAFDNQNVPVKIPQSSNLEVEQSPLLAHAAVNGTTLSLLFKAEPATGYISVSAGQAKGTLPVEIVKPDTVSVEPEVLVLQRGETADVQLTAEAAGQRILLLDGMVSGTSLDPAVLKYDSGTAKGISKGNTSLVINLGSTEIKIPAYIDMARTEVIESFDSADTMKLTGVGFDLENTKLKEDTGNYKEGLASGELTYHMDKGGRTRINIPIGSAIKEKPAGFGIWVYGDGKEAWVRAILLDSKGVEFIADFTGGADGITWTGEWQRLTTSFQSLISTDTGKSPTPSLPLSVRELTIAQDQEALKQTGQIKLDGLEAIYAPE